MNTAEPTTASQKNLISYVLSVTVTYLALFYILAILLETIRPYFILFYININWIPPLVIAFCFFTSIFSPVPSRLEPYRNYLPLLLVILILSVSTLLFSETTPIVTVLIMSTVLLLTVLIQIQLERKNSDATTT